MSLGRFYSVKNYSCKTEKKPIKTIQYDFQKVCNKDAECHNILLVHHTG